MKYLAIFFIVPTLACGQSYSEKFKEQILKSTHINKTDVLREIAPKDISDLLTKIDNSSVVGFIGKSYERVRIKLISVIHDGRNQFKYFVYGKSMLRDSVNEFQGTLTLRNAFYSNDSKFRNVRQGISIGDYELFESFLKKNGGQFKGVFVLRWYLDNQGQIHYDDLEAGLGNNAFVGTWSSYHGQFTETCNWGDYTIPMSGELNKGLKGFYPDEKYHSNGWETYVQYHTSNSEEARKIETTQWWR